MQNQRVIGSLVSASEQSTCSFFFSFFFLFFFRTSALSVELVVTCNYATRKTFGLEITKNKSINPRSRIDIIIAYNTLRTTSSQASDHSLVIDFPEIYFAYLQIYFASYPMYYF